ncbi:hypothetical protein AB3S75_037885 [Citrus x aurantiifolia]
MLRCQTTKQQPVDLICNHEKQQPADRRCNRIKPRTSNQQSPTRSYEAKPLEIGDVCEAAASRSEMQPQEAAASRSEMQPQEAAASRSEMQPHEPAAISHRRDRAKLSHHCNRDVPMESIAPRLLPLAATGFTGYHNRYN